MPEVQAALPANLKIDLFVFEGGQGIVYKGTVDGTSAAIKIYFGRDIERRIEREVRALRAINCVNVVKLLWTGQCNIAGSNLDVVATEFIDGENLELVISQRVLTEVELAQLLVDVCRAIDVLWQKRIVHRDIKPPNILLTSASKYCLIDLGVARHLEATSLTAQGFTWGTPGYMSPEQARCVRQLSCKSDIYALGLVVVEAATGAHLAQRNQMRIVGEDLSKIIPNPIAGYLMNPIVSTMLHPRPTKRPMPHEVIAEIGKLYSGRVHV